MRSTSIWRFRPLGWLAWLAGGGGQAGAGGIHDTPAILFVSVIGVVALVWLPWYWAVSLGGFLRLDRRNVFALMLCIGCVTVLGLLLIVGVTPAGATLLGAWLDGGAH